MAYMNYLSSLNPVSWFQTDYSDQTAFCDTKCKSIRLYANDMIDNWKSLFYSTVSMLFSRGDDGDEYGLVKEYKVLSEYYAHCRCKLRHHYKFGENIINFSMNRRNLTMTRLFGESIEKQYGEGFNEMSNQLKDFGIEETEKVVSSACQESLDEGICAGMCIDFMSKFFSTKRKSQDYLTKIKEISALYSGGATAKAEIRFRFFNAHQNIIISKEKVNEISKQLLEMNEQHRFLIDQAETLQGTMMSAIKEMAVLETEFKLLERGENTNFDTLELLVLRMETQAQKLKSLALEIIKNQSEMDTISFDITEKRQEIQLMESKLTKFSENYLQALMGKKNLECELVLWCGNEPEKKQTSEILDPISGLPTGEYFILIDHPSEGCGHMIALFKASDKRSYIFDPNIGTLRIDGGQEEVIKYLRSVSENTFGFEDGFSWRFYVCKQLQIDDLTN